MSGSHNLNRDKESRDPRGRHVLAALLTSAGVVLLFALVWSRLGSPASPSDVGGSQLERVFNASNTAGTLGFVCAEGEGEVPCRDQLILHGVRRYADTIVDDHIWVHPAHLHLMQEW